MVCQPDPHGLWGIAGPGRADPGQARTWLKTAREGCQQVEDLCSWSAATLWLALDAAWQGEADLAMQLLGELLPVVTQHGYDFLLTRCTHLGLKDDQAALPLLVEALRRGLEPSLRGPAAQATGVIRTWIITRVTRWSSAAWARSKSGAGSQPVTLHDWQREKARQLFQFLLAQRGQWLPREQIVDRLWPYLDADAALQNFKVALNALNRALEPARPAGAAPFFVIRRDNAYMLNPQAHTLLDADAFERGAASSQPDELRRALAIYEEDYLYDSLGEEWAEAERERLRAALPGSQRAPGEPAIGRRGAG